MNTETWYVLEDGSSAHPRDVRPGTDGKLRHKDGRAVAYAPHGPRSRSVDLSAMMELASPNAARAGAGLSPLSQESVKREDGSAVGAGDDIKALREQYFAVHGKRPFPGWDAAELRRRIAESRDAAATDDREMKPEGTVATYRTRGG